MNQIESLLLKIKEIIKLELIRVSGDALSLESIKINFDIPELTHGDYMTNAAMMYAKELSMRPTDLAMILTEKIKEVNGIESAEVAGAGFINIYLKSEIIRSAIQNIGEIKTKYTDKKVLVEHTSINLFKPFSIGHLINNIEGEFISRSLRAGGADVRTICFPSDISLGIAKAIYVIKKDGGIFGALISKFNNEGISYLGDTYRRGVAEYDDHPEIQNEVKEIANDLFNYVGENYEIYETAKSYNLEYFQSFLKEINSGFDLDPIYESEAGLCGVRIVKDHTGEGKVFYKSEGAIVYTPDESRKDIHTGVFINSEGHPTYEAKDLGLIDLKFYNISNFKPDLSITITDVEQIQHFKLVLAAYEEVLINQGLSKINAKLEVDKNIHVPHGRMLFKGQKMSSRLGGVPLAEQVIETIKDEVKERMGEADRLSDMGIKDKEVIAKEIALSSLRIAVLRAKPGININFDPATSLSFEGDSGPYLLYTHARCVSLIEKSKVDILKLEQYLCFIKNQKQISITNLEKTLMHYNEILLHSIEETAPQKLVAYLFSLAREFNSLYAGTIFISDDIETTEHYMQIIFWTKEVLRNALYILGVKAVDKM